MAAVGMMAVLTPTMRVSARVSAQPEFDGRLMRRDINWVTPNSDRSVVELSSYQQQLINDIDTWWKDCDDKTYERVVTTYYGNQTLHALLERCAWHSAQHVRQVIMMLNNLGITPIISLTPDDLDDLPLPEKVWD